MNLIFAVTPYVGSVRFSCSDILFLDQGAGCCPAQRDIQANIKTYENNIWPETAVWTYPKFNKLNKAAAVSFGVLGHQDVNVCSCQCWCDVTATTPSSLSLNKLFRWFWTTWCWIQCLSCLRPSGRTRSSWPTKWSKGTLDDTWAKLSE